LTFRKATLTSFITGLPSDEKELPNQSTKRAVPVQQGKWQLAFQNSPYELQWR
jgi:hypothetical protein